MSCRTALRHHSWVAPVIVGLILAIVVSAAPAVAGPGDEGGNATLGQALEVANKGYVDAQAALDASRKRQADLTQQSADVQAQLARKQEEVVSVARTAYRVGRVSTASALVNSSAPGSFLDRAMAIQVVVVRDDRKLRELSRLHADLAASRARIDTEVTYQQQQVAAMAKRKQEAEQALAAVGGQATGGYVDANSPLAQPAPRGANGSWPAESCTVDDPTTTGCITPRTLHALQQAKAAGFTRFVSCYRPGDRFEHPKGRACDFAAATGGFGGVASGGDRTYGNNLAAYFVRNAGALAVLYVIWFRQIWTPAAGWHAYNSGNGDPSSDHTNHVHLSVF